MQNKVYLTEKLTILTRTFFKFTVIGLFGVSAVQVSVYVITTKNGNELDGT